MIFEVSSSIRQYDAITRYDYLSIGFALFGITQAGIGPVDSFNLTNGYTLGGYTYSRRQVVSG